mmetsp:Transcript_2595/g.8300  ORF Transcript_2595/g.8300 Transcript_2595/m.8300 type:complete len:214 (-) Transcript_2595:59-700(-)
MTSAIASLIFFNVSGSFQYFIIACGPPCSISFIIGPISGSSFNLSIFSFIFLVVSGLFISLIIDCIVGSCIICSPNFCAICANAGFFITPSIACIACCGSTPCPIIPPPGTPPCIIICCNSAADDGPAPNAWPDCCIFAICEAMFSCICLNAGSEAIASAASFMEGSSSIWRIFSTSNGAPPPGMPLPPGMPPNPGGSSPAPAIFSRLFFSVR